VSQNSLFFERVQFCFSSEHHYLQEGELPVILKEVAAKFCSKLHNIAGLLQNVLDFEESKTREPLPWTRETCRDTFALDRMLKTNR
jgi:hypothetical protein